MIGRARKAADGVITSSGTAPWLMASSVAPKLVYRWVPVDEVAADQLVDLAARHARALSRHRLLPGDHGNPGRGGRDLPDHAGHGRSRADRGRAGPVVRPATVQPRSGQVLCPAQS